MKPIRSFMMACFAVVMLAAIVSAQFANCSQSILNDPCSVSVGQTVVTTYNEPFIASNCTNFYSQATDFDLGCGVQAASAFTACRQSGGGFFGCTIEGFGTYLQCNGGALARSRSRRVQRRSQSRASFTRSRRGNFCG